MARDKYIPEITIKLTNVHLVSKSGALKFTDLEAENAIVQEVSRILKGPLEVIGQPVTVRSSTVTIDGGTDQELEVLQSIVASLKQLQPGQLQRSIEYINRRFG